MIQVPNLYCPCEPGMSQYTEAMSQSTLQWAQQFQLLTSEKALERFKKANFALLTARAFPVTENLEAMVAVNDFTTWLFLFDDQVDEGLEGKKEEYLEALTTKLIEVMMSDPIDAVEHTATLPLVAGLSDIWQRLRPLGDTAWQTRFAGRVSEYLQACVWEAKNREQRVFPTIEQYAVARIYTGAVFTQLALIEVMYDIKLPRTIMQHTIVQQLTWSAVQLIAFSNDIFSAPKEIEQNDVHNLVILLQKERNASFQEALALAAELHDSTMRTFEALEQWLPSFDDDVNEQLRRYVLGLRYWIRANVDWSLKDTERYGLTPPVEKDNGHWSFSTKVKV
ncbi:MAG TPA: hypothetical protein VN040_20245 [Pseudosphingobacterium sp.]|nr:hypothetical protein [Pseudosphingobacterium sp.]